jgi:hypothetical protein
MRCVERLSYSTAGLSFWEKNDDYDEDEGIYDDLNLDEEEEKFGRLITEEHDSDCSDDASEGVFPAYTLHDHQTLRPRSRSSFSKCLEET